MSWLKRSISGQNYYDIRDELLAWLDDLKNKSRVLVDWFFWVLRASLFTLSPAFFGAFFSQIFKDYSSLSFPPGVKFLDVIFQFFVTDIRFFVFLFIFAALWVWGTLWRLAAKENLLNTNRIYYILKRFYNEQGFIVDSLDDVRVTIWTPLSSKVKLEKMRLLQVVDYYPRIHNSPDTNNNIRINHSRGRIRRVLRKASELDPKATGWVYFGLIGKCAYESVNRCEMSTHSISIDHTDEIVNVFLKEWHYNKAEARRATKDRKSYLVISLMNKDETDLLGILYLDAGKSGVFSENMKKKITESLPRIADALLPNK
jgi:hypothetical protein